MTAYLQICGGLIGLILLYYGAEFLVKGGVNIATRLKISPLVIGLTLVAFATSAPELVVSVDSALKGMGNISIGNVVGSNIYNALFILGVTALIVPLSVSDGMRFDIALMCVVTVLLIVIAGLKGGFTRPVGGVFLALYAAYMWYLF